MEIVPICKVRHRTRSILFIWRRVFAGRHYLFVEETSETIGKHRSHLHLLSCHTERLFDRSENIERYVEWHVQCSRTKALFDAVAPISTGEYWRSPFTSLCGSKNLVEYIVCDVNVLDSDSKPHVYGKESQKVRPVARHRLSFTRLFSSTFLRKSL